MFTELNQTPTDDQTVDHCWLMCCSQGDLLTVTAKIQLKTETTKLNTPLLRALVRADFRTVSRAPVTGSNKDISGHNYCWTRSVSSSKLVINIVIDAGSRQVCFVILEADFLVSKMTSSSMLAITSGLINHQKFHHGMLLINRFGINQSEIFSFL